MKLIGAIVIAILSIIALILGYKLFFKKDDSSEKPTTPEEKPEIKIVDNKVDATPAYKTSFDELMLKNNIKILLANQIDFVNIVVLMLNEVKSCPVFKMNELFEERDGMEEDFVAKESVKNQVLDFIISNPTYSIETLESLFADHSKTNENILNGKKEPLSDNDWFNNFKKQCKSVEDIKTVSKKIFYLLFFKKTLQDRESINKFFKNSQLSELLNKVNKEAEKYKQDKVEPSIVFEKSNNETITYKITEQALYSYYGVCAFINGLKFKKKEISSTDKND